VCWSAAAGSGQGSGSDYQVVHQMFVHQGWDAGLVGAAAGFCALFRQAWSYAGHLVEGLVEVEARVVVVWAHQEHPHDFWGGEGDYYAVWAS
jgi:hypothetical protein